MQCYSRHKETAEGLALKCLVSLINSSVQLICLKCHYNPVMSGTSNVISQLYTMAED